MRVLVVIPATPGVRNVVRDFIYGCWCKGRRIGGMQMPPLNLLYAATVLADDGNEVDLVDGTSEPERYRSTLEHISRYDVAVCLVSTSSFHTDVETLAVLKRRNPRLRTVIFGPHPTFMPRYSLAKDAVDIIVMREPEFILRDVVRALGRGDDSFRQVDGVGYRDDGGGSVVNRPYPYIDDLDRLPIPDRSLLPANVDYFNPVVKRMPYTTAITSRGCPARCVFCTVPFFYGERTRSRSAASVLEELSLIKSQGYREVMFRDETFTAFPARNREICEELIRRDLGLAWICNARVGSVSRSMMALMKRAGCHMLKFGVESGDQKILDRLGKGILVAKTRENFRWAKELGIDTHAHIMLGNPGETRETIRATVEFAKEIEPTTVSFGILTPYPGTRLFDQVSAEYPEIKDGSSCDLRILHTTAFFNESFCSLCRDELERYVRRAYRQFYLRPKPLARFLRQLDSLEELWRLSVAGANILSFSLGGED